MRDRPAVSIPRAEAVQSCAAFPVDPIYQAASRLGLGLRRMRFLIRHGACANLAQVVTSVDLEYRRQAALTMAAEAITGEST